MDALANFAAAYAEGWIAWVGHAAWQGAIVGLAALALVRLIRRWQAPLRYWILVLALFKFVTPPLTSLPIGVFSLVSVRDSRGEPGGARNVASSTFRSRKPPLPHVGADPSATSELRPESVMRPANEFVVPTERGPKPTTGKASAGLVPARSPLPWPTVVILGHLSGAILVLATFAFRAMRLHRSWRRMEQSSQELAALARGISRTLGLRQIPTLRISRDVQVPYSAGILRPTVVLPFRNVQELSVDEVSAILSHEMAHHSRGDLWLNLAQVLIGAAWWFHPVVWMLNRTIRSVREECCDDLLLSRKLVTDVTYCSTLLHVARSGIPRRSVAPVCVSIADGLHPLSSRIERIMDETLPRRERPGALAVAALFALAFVALPGIQTLPAASPEAAVITAARSRPQTEIRRPQTRARSDELFSTDAHSGESAASLSPAGTSVGRIVDEQNRTAENAFVFGRVTDGDGRAITGATVAIGQYFNTFDFPATTKTDGVGEYRFTKGVAGDSLLTVFKVGLAPHTRTVAVGTIGNEFNVTLLPGRRVRLRVTDKAGEPVGDAGVVPFRWADTVTLMRLHDFGKTDTDGIWSWDWAPERELTCLISKPGCLDCRYVVPRDAVEIHEVTLLPELRLAVKVVDDATGLPMPAYQATLGLIHSKISGPEQWLAPVAVKSLDGEHTLRQSAIAWNECTVQIEADGYHPARSRNVRASEENVRVEIRLRAARQRDAVALNAGGTPAADALVYLGTETTTIDLLQIEASSSSHGFLGRTDSEGRFRFGAHGELFSIFVIGNTGLGIAASGEINDTANEPVQIQLKPWARVEGTLRNGQKDLSDESVQLAIEVNRSGIGNVQQFIGLGVGTSRSARTDRTGRFAFDRVPPGITVRVGHLVPVATSRGPMLGYRHEAFMRPAAGEVQSIALGGWGRTVVGRFQMKDEAWAVDWGASFGHMAPSVKPEEVDIWYRPHPRFPIHQDGTFHLEEVPPGKYTIAFELLVLKPESSLKQKSLSGLLIDTVTIPERAAEDADQPVDLATLSVGYSNKPR